MRFTNVFSPYYKLMTELCKCHWNFSIIYNDDDGVHDPRIEFVYRNELAVIRTVDDARYWLDVLEKYEPTKARYKQLVKELQRLNKEMTNGGN